jgi:hypothetical protein
MPHKPIFLRSWRWSVVLILMVASFSISVGAQQGATGNVGRAYIGPPTSVQLDWTAKPTSPTAEQRSRLERAIKRTHLSGPVTGQTVPLGVAPANGTSSEVAPAPAAQPIKPQAPNDPLRYRLVDFGGVIPAGFKSNIMESSVGTDGRFTFYTGNWFAARSINGGTTQTFVDPFADFPNFCCDQVTLYEPSRDRIYWYRQGLFGGSSNIFRLGVSSDGAASFCFYDFSPTSVDPSWTNQWFDYPHLQVSANNLYIATNVFDAGDNFVRTLMLQLPLDSLSACAGFTFFYAWTSDWSTWVPVQGADYIMYFASNWPNSGTQNNRLGIWKWDEVDGSLSFVERTLSAWTFTSDNAVCGSATGNWLGRTDQRVLTGTRYRIQGSNLRIPGRIIVGWWWNVAQGGVFPRPYVEAAAFYEDTLTQVSGAQGRPYIRGNTTCYGYPSAAANIRGDLGMVVNFGPDALSNNPGVAFAIADNVVVAPQPWSLTTVRNSNSRPPDPEWGDYNTVRVFQPEPHAWVAAAHYRPSSNPAVDPSPLYFVFGRERDFNGWNRFRSS